jgi:hypothetical protein
MKNRRPSRWITPALLLACGCSSLAFGGSYIQNFNSVADGSIADGSTPFGDGSIVRTNNAGTQVGSWTTTKSFRMTTDNQQGVSTSYFLPNLEPTHTTSSFSASFDLKFKSDNVAADAFAFNFGTIKTTDSSIWASQGMYDASGVKTGPMLSVVWDTYSGDDPKSIEVFLNGARIGNNTSIVPIVPNYWTTGDFKNVTIDWADNLLSVSYGGQSVFSGLSTGSFAPALNDTFAFNAVTGGSTQDVFLDNINISTVPTPAVTVPETSAVPEASTSLGLLALGAGGLLTRRRLKRKA